MKTFAPILLFTYKRLDTLQLTVQALQANFLASESELYVFSDNAKHQKDVSQIEAVREYLKTIKGFKQVTIINAIKNKGLANSIINGVNEIIVKHDKVIVVEDDLVTSNNFLDFMNAALSFYENNPKVLAIAGYSAFENKNAESDAYFTQRASSWGWATWKSEWEKIDWQVKTYNNFKNNKKQRKLFNRMGSDLSVMLHKQMNSTIDSWAIRFVFHQFQNSFYSVHPNESKIKNVGIGTIGATNTHSKANRFDTNLDTTNKRNFIFENTITIDQKVIKKFIKPYSILTRIKYKILDLL